MNIRLSIILIFVLSLTFSCKDLKSFKQTRADLLEKRKQDRMAESNKVDIKIEAAVQDTVRRTPVDSLFLSYERTPCYGRCPIYKVKIYHSGYVTYEGINFVDNLGYNQSRISDKEMTQLYTWLTDSQFFELENSYDDENVMDLPAKIILVNAMGQKKKIKARYKFPVELKTLFAHIDDFIETKKWQPVKNINNQ